ncbi:hypothetical protein C9374_011120 [Naegleria lovaniensis]|uniref:Uncharacterized protein n=1 Tax=Naegleria lovaniensis TaxID=51637 RepID=A0AA88GH66_NAELO|nr:uncharacterized protein C9374_011120 [Naegleria lovaniensis]KAG2374041.1 hypothetical protein C9374_011120 [Naegleria lovaniensis]
MSESSSSPLWSMFTREGNQAVEEALHEVINRWTPELPNLLNACSSQYSKEGFETMTSNDDDIIVMDMIYEIQHLVGEKGRGKTFLYKYAEHPEDWIHGHDEVGDTAVRERLYCYLKGWMENQRTKQD